MLPIHLAAVLPEGAIFQPSLSQPPNHRAANNDISSNKTPLVSGACRTDCIVPGGTASRGRIARETFAIDSDSLLDASGSGAGDFCCNDFHNDWLFWRLRFRRPYKLLLPYKHLPSIVLDCSFARHKVRGKTICCRELH